MIDKKEVACVFKPIKKAIFIKRFKRGGSLWNHSLPVILVVLSLLFCLPLGALTIIATSDVNVGLWLHLNQTILWPALGTTLYVFFGVGLLVMLFGVSSAWLVTFCRFPGQRAFVTLLFLPLALPTYVSAFAYVEFLGFTGPVQNTIRAILGVTSLTQYWFPDYRSTNGAILVISLALYPYVYITSRAAFMMQTANIFDAGRTLGARPWRLFRTIALPMARPGIIIGVALALMEAANDIGAVEFFGVRTLTTLIFDVWLNRSSLATAAQIALLFLMVMVFLLWIERRAREAQRLYSVTTKMVHFEPFALRGFKAVLAFFLCAFLVCFGFLVPVAVLANAAFFYSDGGVFQELIKPAQTSMLLSLTTMLVTVIAGFILAYASNTRPGALWTLFVRLITLGYAMPGVILALGVLVALVAIDARVNMISRALFDVQFGVVLSGSLVALIFAYSIRFMPMAYGSNDVGFQHLSPNFMHAARTLGRSQPVALRQISMPLLQPALLSGAILVFVECMKELPVTLVLRPFNTDTLATRVYEAASLEIFEQGAAPALTIVGFGLIPVIFLSHRRLP